MGKKVIITGTSGGFGKLIAQGLLNQGHSVVGTMRGVEERNKDVANELKQLGAHIVEMDVTHDASVTIGMKKAIEALGGVDVVVNNAGVAVAGMIEHFTTDDYKKVFEVNVFGVQRVNRAALPVMRKNGSGLIVYISSLLGRITLPFYGPYNASKWALEAMAENYRLELSGFGIESAIVEPGAYPTDIMSKLIYPSDNSRNDEYGDFMNAPAQMGETFGKAMAKNPEQKPEKVSEQVIKLINMPDGERPFRTVVDDMGMRELINSSNNHHEEITHQLLSSFEMESMLTTKKLQHNI